MDADVEICSLQNFGSAGGAKECAQYRLSSFVTSARDSLRIILVTDAISENGIKRPLTLVLSPQAGRGGIYTSTVRRYGMRCVALRKLPRSEEGASMFRT
jgi:hypothetical protein